MRLRQPVLICIPDRSFDSHVLDMCRHIRQLQLQAPRVVTVEETWVGSLSSYVPANAECRARLPDDLTVWTACMILWREGPFVFSFGSYHGCIDIYPRRTVTVNGDIVQYQLNRKLPGRLLQHLFINGLSANFEHAETFLTRI